MDLSESLRPIPMREVQIKHPATDEPTGLVFRIRPVTDPKVKAAKHRITNARLQSKKARITSEQIDTQSAELILAAVDGWEWHGDATWKGSKPEFNEENLRAVLKNDAIREQLDAELGDVAAFFKT